MRIVHIREAAHDLCLDYECLMSERNRLVNLRFNPSEAGLLEHEAACLEHIRDVLDIIEMHREWMASHV